MQVVNENGVVNIERNVWLSKSIFIKIKICHSASGSEPGRVESGQFGPGLMDWPKNETKTKVLYDCTVL